MSTKPHTFHIPVDRRRFFKSMAIASGGFMLPGFLAEALTVAPTVTQGPYYPLAKNIPLDKDNDLVRLDDKLTLAGLAGASCPSRFPPPARSTAASTPRRARACWSCSWSRRPSRASTRWPSASPERTRGRRDDARHAPDGKFL